MPAQTFTVLAVAGGLSFVVLDSPNGAPVPVVEIAFATAPTVAPTWTDVSAYVESFSLRRGRQSPLESAGAGTATVRLDNGDRRFDPQGGGPYAGNLKPMRRIRISAAWKGELYPLFTGYVDGFPQRRENYGHQFVDVSCSDAYKPLALAAVNGTFPQQRTDERIGAILTAINFTTGQAWLTEHATYGLLGSTTFAGPVGDRALDEGDSEVQATTLENTTALAHVQAVEQSERGFLFAARDGAITLHNRERRLLGAAATPGVILGDDPAGGELPYVEATFDYSDQELANDVRVTREGGTEQVAADGTSQTDYFPRTISRSVLVPTDSEALTIAEYLISQYKEPRPRITALTLDPHDQDGLLWPHFLGRELGDPLLVRATPLGGGSRVSQTSLLEGLSVDWTAPGNLWGGGAAVSEADTTAYWRLEAAGSALGTTTVAAY